MHSTGSSATQMTNTNAIRSEECRAKRKHMMRTPVTTALFVKCLLKLREVAVELGTLLQLDWQTNFPATFDWSKKKRRQDGAALRRRY
jgi:hypothetical protein